MGVFGSVATQARTAGFVLAQGRRAFAAIERGPPGSGPAPRAGRATWMTFCAIVAIAAGILALPRQAAAQVTCPGLSTTGSFSDYAAGQNADASGYVSANTAVGATAWACTNIYTFTEGHNSAFGDHANAAGDNVGASYNTAIGYSTNASSGNAVGNSYNTALGAFANASSSATGAAYIGTTSYNTAIGYHANASSAMGDGDNIAIGSGTYAGVSGANAGANIAIGLNASTGLIGGSGLNNVALGANTSVSGNNSVAIGGSLTTGGGASAYYNAVAIGTASSANFDSSVALGVGAATTRANQVAIGTGTSTYTLTGVNSAASLAAQSAGLFMLTTDANGNLATAAIPAGSGGVSCTEPFSGAFRCGTGAVAAAANATAVGQNALAGGSFANAGTTALGSGAQAGTTALGQTNATAIGFNATANAQSATAIGQGSSATASGAVALGQGSVANVANTVSIGAVGSERKIVNVANGTIAAASTDAITGGQLMTANQRVAAAFGGGAGVDGSGQLTSPSYTIQGNSYNNVGGALGALDTQVTTNTASIGTLNTNVATNTANIATNTTGINSLNTQVASNTSSIGTLNTQVASNTANIATNTTDIGNLRSQVNNGSIGLVQQDAATRAITVGKTTDGTLVDVSGTAGNRTVTGVGTGAVSATSVDAVNGSQLYATNQNVAANTAAIAGLSSIVTGLQGAAGGSPYLKSNSTGAAASAAGANANAIGSGSSASGANSIALGTGSQATQSGSIAVGMNSASTGTNAIAIGTGATATGSVAVGAAASAANGGAAYGDGAVATATLSTAVGPNASATAANAVAIGSGSTNTVANTVSFGSVGNERRLTNVAAGINSTDAVNVGQLQSSVSGFQSQIGGLQTQVIDNQREARRGIVAAVAVAPVLMPSAAGKTTVAVNTGFYRGESGVGIGVSHRLNFALPTVVYGSYSNGGGVEHVGRAGMAVEF